MNDNRVATDDCPMMLRPVDVSAVRPAVSSPVKYGTLSADPTNDYRAVKVASKGCIFSGKRDQSELGGVDVLAATND